MPREEKAIYLTFDDGPHPDITMQVLDALGKYGAKATFFCVGENALRYPEVVKACIDRGHAIGNHTMHHLNGWKSSAAMYIKDVAESESILYQIVGEPVSLFRPPYGRLNLAAWRHLTKRYKVVMWDVIAGDFVQDWSPEKVSNNILNHAGPGSVIVLHDSEKCLERMMPALESCLKHFTQLGYQFKAIPQG